MTVEKKFNNNKLPVVIVDFNVKWKLLSEIEIIHKGHFGKILKCHKNIYIKFITVVLLEMLHYSWRIG